MPGTPSKPSLASVTIAVLLTLALSSACSGSTVADPVGTSPGQQDLPASTPTTGLPAPTISSNTTSTTPSPEVTSPEDRPIPTDAAELAAELSLAELAIRDPALDEASVMAWGRRQQRLYREMAQKDESAEQVLAEVAAPVQFAVERNWTARRELSSLVTSGSLSTVLPAWRIREPLPVSELRSYYEESEATSGIEWEYLAAINLIETRMGRIQGLSTAGATGPMQFLPSTWNECCEGDPTLDRDAIIGAGVYLRARGGPEDMERALYGYNNSDYYVAAVSAYAEVLREDPRALAGYHAWEVYFRSEAGLVRIPAGYEEPEPVDAAEWIAANPDNVIGS